MTEPILLKRPWLWSVFGAALLAIPVIAMLIAHQRKTELPIYGTVPAFAFTDQTGQPLTSQDLTGKVWIADFVFTSCSERCPLLSAQMQRLQTYVQNRGFDARIRLISITVDPDRDTTERLSGYAAGFHANANVWKFVRGPAKAVEDAVINGFKIGVTREKSATAPGGFDILHGGSLVLVDTRGRIRGYYDSTEPGQMAALREQLASLMSKGGA